MKEINIYECFDSWLSETPDAVIKGKVKRNDGICIEILDENNYTQLINLQKIYAIVYEG